MVKVCGECLFKEATMGNAGMRVAIGQFSEMTDEKLRFGAQLGVTSVADELAVDREPGSVECR